MSDNNLENEKTTDRYIQFVTFQVGKEIYGIPVFHTREVLYLEEITNVPDTVSYIKGVIDLRGQIIPLIGLRSLFKLESQAYDSDTVVIISFIKGTIIGLIADAVLDVIMLNQRDIQLMKSFSDQKKEYVVAMSKINSSIILLLDVNRLLDHKELEKLVETSAS